MSKSLPEVQTSPMEVLGLAWNHDENFLKKVEKGGELG